MTENSALPQVGVTILASGSQGNCTILSCGSQAIMIDAGLSFRETQRRMKQFDYLPNLQLLGILVTHEHTDHVGGLRVCSEKLDVPVYATAGCANVLRARDARMNRQMALFAAGGTYQIGPFSIAPFTIPHDAKDPVAFVISVADRQIGVATDIGYASSMLEYRLKGCDALILESNHDLNMLAASKRDWSLKQRIMGRQGHLSNESSAQLLERVITPNTRKVVLAHISHECNTDDKAMNCASQVIHHLHRPDITLTTAQQETPLETIWV